MIALEQIQINNIYQMMTITNIVIYKILYNLLTSCIRTCIVLYFFIELISADQPRPRRRPCGGGGLDEARLRRHRAAQVHRRASRRTSKMTNS